MREIIDLNVAIPATTLPREGRMQEHEKRGGRARIGDRFDDLTIEALEEKTPCGTVWLCRCSCGGATVRSTARLRYGVSQGERQRCKACSAAARRERADVYAKHRQKAYRAAWEEYGSLWSDHAVEFVTSRIRDDVGEQLGGWSASGVLPAEAMPARGTRSPRDAKPAGMTLVEIGKVLGLSRERVRQIEAGALRKLREVPLVREMYLAEIPARVGVKGEG